MPDDAPLWTAPPRPLTARPPQLMWSVRKDGKQTGCTLVGQGEDGWDVVLSRNGDEFYGRRWMMRADAVAEAGELLRELERDGWQTVPTTGRTSS